MGRSYFHGDWLIVVSLACLCAFGAFLLLTISASAFWQQVLFMTIAACLGYMFSRIDGALLWWFAPIGYLFGVVFLCLSYIGPSVRGATRWIVVGGMQVQPSELTKPLFLLAFAYFLSAYPPRKLSNVPLHLFLFAIPFLLIFKQPDLGSAIVYGAFWISMMLAAGLPIMSLVLTGLVGALAVPIVWSHLLPYQIQRVNTFLNPGLDPAGAGYNALQSVIAIGSGQWFGRGLGRGTQSHLRFLPEHHTDFIFATLVEEFGFFGGFMLLLLYALLLARIILPLFSKSIQPPIFIFTIGVFSMLLAQLTINIAMNMGLMPITGITLPFVSYGGSSLLSIGIAFGVLWALQRAR